VPDVVLKAAGKSPHWINHLRLLTTTPAPWWQQQH